MDVFIWITEGSGPLVQLLPDVAASVAELNATLGFDLYGIPDQDELGTA